MVTFRLTESVSSSSPNLSALTLGEFFASNVTTDYISHGEVFCGRARSLTEWVPDLSEVVAQEVWSSLNTEREHKQVWVATENEILVGMAIISLQSEEVATFDDMVVMHGERSKGRGADFFKAVLNGLKSEMPQFKHFMCESGTHNEGAHRLIERLGFRNISKVFCYTV